MKTYASQIIFSIKCDGKFTGQYDEQWRLVLAEDEESALERSKEIGKAEGKLMVDRHGRTIYWEMIAVKDIQELELGHGALLTSKVVDVTAIAAPLWEQQLVN